MMKECPFNSRGKCDIWVDYQVAWVELLEARLTEAGIPIPE